LLFFKNKDGGTRVPASRFTYTLQETKKKKREKINMCSSKFKLALHGYDYRTVARSLTCKNGNFFQGGKNDINVSCTLIETYASSKFDVNIFALLLQSWNCAIVMSSKCLYWDDKKGSAVMATIFGQSNCPNHTDILTKLVIITEKPFEWQLISIYVEHMHNIKILYN
jgi:hypothetical protein